MKYYWDPVSKGMYDDEWYRGRTMMVPDPDWSGEGEAPLIEVPNPNTNIPASAIEVSSELREQLIAGLQSGKVIIINSNGIPELADTPPPGYAERLQSMSAIYQADVDKYNRAFAIAYLSDGPTQESKQAAIRADFLGRKVKHAADIADLKAEYGVGV